MGGDQELKLRSKWSCQIAAAYMIVESRGNVRAGFRLYWHLYWYLNPWD